MATAYHNLSEYDFNSVPNAEAMKFGIVVSEWNFNITGALLKGAVDTLKKHGAKDENILVKTVPGSFELTFGANQMMENCDLDAIIAIGCVIKGDTPHFDYVCMGATQGITELNATGYRINGTGSGYRPLAGYTYRTSLVMDRSLRCHVFVALSVSEVPGFR